MNKTRKFILSAFTPVLLAVGAFAGIKANKTIETKAEDEYTTIETNVVGCQNHYGWLAFTFDEFSNPSSTVHTLGDFTNFNTLTNIYVNGDESLKAFTVSGNRNMGYHAGKEKQFFSAADATYGAENFKLVTTITVPAGTEFPSVETAQGTAKVKYVTKNDVTFYNIRWDKSASFEFVHEDNVNIVDTDVTFDNQKPNPAWPGFKLSVNDYSDTANQSVLNKPGIFNFLTQYNDVTVTAPDGVVYDVFDGVGVAYVNFNDACKDYVSLNTPHSEWNSSFATYRVVSIPKGSIFPSWSWQANYTDTSKPITLYRTTKDVVAYPDGQWGATYTNLNPTFVDNEIMSVGGNGSFDQGGKQYTNLVYDVDLFNVTKAGANLGGSIWTLCNLFANTEFYAGSDKLSAIDSETSVVNTCFGAQFLDFSSGADYLMQIQTSALSTADKIVVKKGAIFPSPAYIKGTSTEWYRVPADQTFIKVAGAWGSVTHIERFINTYMHTEIETSESGTGLCVSSGWYASAKTAFNALGSANIIVMANKAEYAPYWSRINAWAAANGESFDYTSSTMKVNNSPVSTLISNESNLVVLIPVIVIALAAGAFLVLKKRKTISK